MQACCWAARRWNRAANRRAAEMPSERDPGDSVRNVTFPEGEERLCVEFLDGRRISVPLAWYPRLLHATPEQRNNWQIIGAGFGIHWPDVDEDLSAEGLLRGQPAPGAVRGVRKQPR